MDNWNEIRTAYQVASLGTVSAAADALGVHRVTVIRHIDALEELLGEKLFQRHQRGYTTTEAGEDLLQVGKTTEEQFNQLAGRIKGRGLELSGELVVTSLSVAASILVPALQEFQARYPAIMVRYLTGERLFRLEYGEAHVAVRAGARPDQPDNVVQPFFKLRLGLYASSQYAELHSIPQNPEQYKDHRFVGQDDPNSPAPFNKWMQENVDDNNIVFRATNQDVMEHAVRAGIGIGFLSASRAENLSGLIEVLPPHEEWQVSFWLVTHVDLHRTAKVQAILKIFKQHAGDLGLL